ncbi:MAG: AAA family ATPase, partial [Firmicutes bacterium]|nr:AAA family ATPase [Bacillota bacterium]
MSVQLIDEVVDITFRNDENGYSVLRLKQSGTATGVFAFVSVGQELNMAGEWVNNPKFGKQFKVSSYGVMVPNTPAKIKQFIGSGLIKGIGPVTADRVVAMFGKETLRIMDEDPMKLSRVKGISRDKAKDIGERYALVKAMQDSIIFLSRFSISINMAVKIFKRFGEQTIEIVSANPYILIEKISGIGFLTADKMAMDLGVAYNGNFRVRAGLVHILKQESEVDGHTFLPRLNLLLEACKLLKIKQPDLEPVFEDVVSELCLDKLLTLVRREGEAGFMLTRFFNDERVIAGKLVTLAGHVDQSDDGELGRTIKHYEEINKIKLHDMQRDAVKMATRHGVCVITGGPGTGKTTIVKAILYISEAQGRKAMLLSPTGRAAKRLEDTTGRPASTIHRALMAGSGGEWSEEQGGKLEADLIIVDEVSMCDASLTAALLRSLSPRTA